MKKYINHDCVPDSTNTLDVCACGGGGGVLRQLFEEEIYEFLEQIVVAAHHQVT